MHIAVGMRRLGTIVSTVRDIGTAPLRLLAPFLRPMPLLEVGPKLAERREPHAVPPMALPFLTAPRVLQRPLDDPRALVLEVWHEHASPCPEALAAVLAARHRDVRILRVRAGEMPIVREDLHQQVDATAAARP